MEYQKVAKVSKNSQPKSQRQSQMRMIKKYLKKDMYIQEKDKKY